MKKREIPLLEYDDDVPAVIEPAQLLDPIDMAEHCLLCFFQDVIDTYVEAGQLLYGGDDLSGDGWDHRGWQKQTSTREKLAILAAEACLLL